MIQITFYEFISNDNLVKTKNSRWISKKLHIGGVQFFYYYGVHKVRCNDRKVVTTNKMKSFYDAISKKKSRLLLMAGGFDG